MFTTLVELTISEMENHPFSQEGPNSKGKGMEIYGILCSNFSGFYEISAAEFSRISQVPPVTRYYKHIIQ